MLCNRHATRSGLRSTTDQPVQGSGKSNGSLRTFGRAWGIPSCERALSHSRGELRFRKSWRRASPLCSSWCSAIVNCLPRNCWSSAVSCSSVAAPWSGTRARRWRFPFARKHLRINSVVQGGELGITQAAVHKATRERPAASASASKAKRGPFKRACCQRTGGPGSSTGERGFPRGSSETTARWIRTSLQFWCNNGCSSAEQRTLLSRRPPNKQKKRHNTS